uniref:B30.2/SPRY domain-containing protein n=1 Tax=Esox lucius TaxID=8010 RepID=A0AAY5K968_ESOLU
MGQPINFMEAEFPTEPGVHQERPASPVPSCLSLKSEKSMGQPINFMEAEFPTEPGVHQERPASPVPSCLSMKSEKSMGHPINFREGQFPTEPGMEHGGDYRRKAAPRPCEILLSVRQDIKTKMKNKYKILCEGIGQHGNPTLLKDIYTELYITEGGGGGVNKEHEVTQIEMASKRQTTQDTPIKCRDIFKPIKHHLLIRKPTSESLNHEDIFSMTKGYITSDRTASSYEYESDISRFHLSGQDKHIKRKGLRNLTKGIAGIGKTVSVHKVILDWADGKANQDIHFIFPLPFRDLNRIKDENSLMQLLSRYFPELKEINWIEDGLTKTVFIFDGLDECRLPLDFKNNKKCCDVTEPTSVDVLLTNLIEGNLLPSALLWITTRPAAANRIPPECVDQVTEIRGFNEPQKEEYFRKKITDQNLATEIIKHIKTSRSLHIMCHIPVFCWISATVLESMLKEAEKDKIPQTLTQMYEHFLLIQTSIKNKKYNKYTETNPKELSQSDKDMILKLSKLAFQQLQNGNLIFYEEELRECDIDVSEASEYSALCTEIFKEESGLYQEKVFSFVHLSIQEFLAAVHVLESCLGKEELVFPLKDITESPFQHDDDDDDDGGDSDGDDLINPFPDYDEYDHYDYEDYNDVEVRKSDKLSDLYFRAVDQALKSENGHLDLFLRFLLGLSLESNQNLLQGILTLTGSETQSNMKTVKRTVEYLSKKIKMETLPERIINLFHCLNELGDNYLVADIQTSLQSGTLSETKLEPHQCSALAYLFLMSEEVLEEFDMKTYKTSQEGYQRLLPIVKTCKRALLDGCILTYESCQTLALALHTPNCPLRELDLSYNHLEDRGVELLCAGLTSPFCNIQTLVLGHCGLTEDCCSDLASVLRSSNSQLKQLDLKDNDLLDTGITLLSVGLEDPNCQLHTLGNRDSSDQATFFQSSTVQFCLSGCVVTEKGSASLDSALKSNPSHLKALDLSYNHPGDSGFKLLSAGLEDPNWRLENLRMDHGGECRLKSGPRKYACDLRLDLNTVNYDLLLSEENRMVTWGTEEQLYPDHPERFVDLKQVLCREGLSGRRYWEVEWDGCRAYIGMTYKGINRRGEDDDCKLGDNDKSWILFCKRDSYSACHNNNTTVITVTPSDSHRVGVYLDWSAGNLSFYRVSSDTLTHLKTFHTIFTEPLYPGFRVGLFSCVSLCQVVPVSNTT